MNTNPIFSYKIRITKHL